MKDPFVDVGKIVLVSSSLCPKISIYLKVKLLYLENNNKIQQCQGLTCGYTLFPINTPTCNAGNFYPNMIYLIDSFL